MATAAVAAASVAAVAAANFDKASLGRTRSHFRLLNHLPQPIAQHAICLPYVQQLLMSPQAL